MLIKFECPCDSCGKLDKVNKGLTVTGETGLLHFCNWQCLEDYIKKTLQNNQAQ